MLKLLLLLFISSSFVYSNDAVLLKKGNEAPFTGVLVSEQRLDRLVTAEKSNLTLKDLRLIDGDIIKYQNDQIKQLNSEITKKEWSSIGQSLLMFILGVTTTITVVNNVHSR